MVLLDFKNILLSAKQGNENEFSSLLNTYRWKIKRFSYFDGKYDEDLESELYLTFLRCIRVFDVEYKPKD